MARPDQKNQYQRAIQSVGDIIEDYDSDKYFPVLGFGARLPPNYDTASHIFFVNGDTENPYCFRVKGIINILDDLLMVVKGRINMINPF